MRESARRFVELGDPVGDFLRSVLSNDLRGAYGYADHINVERIGDWMDFVYNEIPSSCHGSPGEYKRWIRIGGARGLAAFDDFMRSLP